MRSLKSLAFAAGLSMSIVSASQAGGSHAERFKSEANHFLDRLSESGIKLDEFRPSSDDRPYEETLRTMIAQLDPAEATLEQLIDMRRAMKQLEPGFEEHLLARLGGERKNEILEEYYGALLTLGWWRRGKLLERAEATARSEVFDLDRKIVDAPILVNDNESQSFIPFAEITTPVEIGAVLGRLRPNGQASIHRTYEQLIDPGIPLDPRVTKYTGIAQEDLAGKPKLAKALPHFMSFVPREAAIFAHNAQFDVSLLGYRMRELGLAPLSNPIWDIKAIARAAFPGLPSYSVKDLIKPLGIGESEAHRGLPDSRQEFEILRLSLVRIAQQLGIPFAELSFRHIESIVEQLAFAKISNAMLPLELKEPRPLPDDWLAEFERVNDRRHKAMLPKMLRDVAAEMGVDYDALRLKLLEINSRF